MEYTGEDIVRIIRSTVESVTNDWCETFCEVSNTITEIDNNMPEYLGDSDTTYDSLGAYYEIDSVRDALTRYRDNDALSDNEPFNDGKAIEIYEENSEECDKAYKWADGWPSLVELAESADSFYELECNYKANAARFYCINEQRRLIDEILEELENIGLALED